MIHASVSSWHLCCSLNLSLPILSKWVSGPPFRDSDSAFHGHRHSQEPWRKSRLPSQSCVIHAWRTPVSQFSFWLGAEPRPLGPLLEWFLYASLAESSRLVSSAVFEQGTIIPAFSVQVLSFQINWNSHKLKGSLTGAEWPIKLCSQTHRAFLTQSSKFSQIPSANQFQRPSNRMVRFITVGTPSLSYKCLHSLVTFLVAKHLTRSLREEGSVLV